MKAMSANELRQVAAWIDAGRTHIRATNDVWLEEDDQGTLCGCAYGAAGIGALGREWPGDDDFDGDWLDGEIATILTDAGLPIDERYVEDPYVRADGLVHWEQHTLPAYLTTMMGVARNDIAQVAVIVRALADVTEKRNGTAD